MRTTFIRTSAVATIFALLVSAGTALADRDGKGGGKGGGGDRDGGGRSGSSDRGNSSRSSGDSGRSSRSSSRSSDSNKGNSSGPSTFRSNKGSDDSNKGDSNKSLKDFQSPKQFQGKPDQSGPQSQGPRDYKALRPTDDKVRDFLKDNNNRNNNKDADRFKNRNPKDRETVDREFNKWQNTWDGKKGDKNDKGNRVGDGRNSHDNRDWSGKWKNSDRFTTADRIRNDWRYRKNKDYVFNDNWWNNKHRGNYWNFWGNYGRRYNNPYYWWGWSTGPRLGSWFVFNWGTPYYWDYGQGEYIYADNGAIYVNGRWYQPAPVFYQQTQQLIDQSPVLTADTAAKLEWMPLGVFAATPDGLNEPDITVQLAVTKEGQIGGTAFDPKSGGAYNIQGTVDKKTQRAVWSYTNDQNKRVMMETSVYNLTQPEATGLVHYSPTDMRVVELVRLEQPEAGAANSSPSLPAPPLNP